MVVVWVVEELNLGWLRSLRPQSYLSLECDDDKPVRELVKRKEKLPLFPTGGSGTRTFDLAEDLCASCQLHHPHPPYMQLGFPYLMALLAGVGGMMCPQVRIKGLVRDILLTPRAGHHSVWAVGWMIELELASKLAVTGLVLVVKLEATKPLRHARNNQEGGCVIIRSV